MRRTSDNGGALSFRAWADGSVVYDARVYASDTVLSGGQRNGMRVEDAFLHALGRASGDEGKEQCLFAAAQHVLVGGVEIWIRRPVLIGGVENRFRSPATMVNKQVEKPDLADAGGEDNTEDGVGFSEDVAPVASSTERLRFVFVAR